MPDLPTIVSVSGGRAYRWSDADTDLFDRLVRFFGVTEIWHGGAIGVDEAVDRRARLLGLGVRVFLPEPTLLPGDLARALLARTAKMIDELDQAVHHEGHLGGVWLWPGGEGTDFAAGHARRRRLSVVDLRWRRI